MKGLAITDHGQTLGGHLNSVFYERLNDPIPGIKFLKGVECNLLEDKGAIDLPTPHLKYMDIILMGIHPNIQPKLGEKVYTDMMIAAMELNPEVDIITHPNDPVYPLDFDKLAKAANKYDKVIEINNSKNLLNRTTIEITQNLVKAMMDNKTRVVISSDAHALSELGLDGSVRPILKELNFPEELVVNSTAKEAFDFIEERKRKRKEI
jgi:putative hydrolase